MSSDRHLDSYYELEKKVLVQEAEILDLNDTIRIMQDGIDQLISNCDSKDAKIEVLKAVLQQALHFVEADVDAYRQKLNIGNTIRSVLNGE